MSSTGTRKNSGGDGEDSTGREDGIGTAVSGEVERRECGEDGQGQSIEDDREGGGGGGGRRMYSGGLEFGMSSGIRREDG